MSNRSYRTANGQTIDMDRLRLVNETVVAVGNTRVNARGDAVNPDGSIKETRNEIMSRTYRTNAVIAGVGRTNNNGNTQTETTDTGGAVTAKRTNKTQNSFSTKTETTPMLMRGSLAQAIIDTTPTSPVESDLLTTTTETRTIKRI